MLIHTFKRALEQAKLGLSRHRIDLLCKLLPTLIQTRSVNLRKLACGLPDLTNIDSQYRRLQRFFSSGLCPSVFTRLIIDKLVVAGQPLLLVLDRTHWQLGQTDLNLLCLGLVFQGVSIPLMSLSLQRPGNSHTRERKQVMRQALAYLKGSTCCLLADREFIGKDWFRFLLRQRDVSFIIRIRCNGWVTLDDGQLRYLASMTRYWKRGPTCTFYNSHALPIAALESRRPSPAQRRAAVTGDQSIRSRQHRHRLWASLVYRNRVWVSQIQRLPRGRNPIDPAPKTASFNRSTRGRAPMVSAHWTARASVQAHCQQKAWPTSHQPISAGLRSITATHRQPGTPI